MRRFLIQRPLVDCGRYVEGPNSQKGDFTHLCGLIHCSTGRYKYNFLACQAGPLIVQKNWKRPTSPTNQTLIGQTIGSFCGNVCGGRCASGRRQPAPNGCSGFVYWGFSSPSHAGQNPVHEAGLLGLWAVLSGMLLFGHST